MYCDSELIEYCTCLKSLRFPTFNLVPNFWMELASGGVFHNVVPFSSKKEACARHEVCLGSASIDESLTYVRAPFQLFLLVDIPDKLTVR